MTFDIRDVKGIVATQGTELDLEDIRQELRESCDQSTLELFDDCSMATPELTDGWPLAKPPVRT